MTQNELKQLSRVELLEIMIEQAEEIEQLKAELKAQQEMVKDREVKINNAGSIAEASLMLSGIFETAQTAADQYLENVHQTEDVCGKMQDEAKKQADQIIAEAEDRAYFIEKEALQNAIHYWEHISQKLETFYAEHKGLKELLAEKSDT